MNDQEILDKLKKQAEEESSEGTITIDKNAFPDNEPETKDENESSIDEKENTKEVYTFEDKLEYLKMSKDDIMSMILEISDNGYIEEKTSVFGNNIEVMFKSSSLGNSEDFIEMFDKLTVNTQAKAEYYLNLYSLASILVKYKGKDIEYLGVEDRAGWIRDNIPVPIYKTLLRESSNFHSKIEMLSSEDVRDFF